MMVWTCGGIVSGCGVETVTRCLFLSLTQSPQSDYHGHVQQLLSHMLPNDG